MKKLKYDSILKIIWVCFVVNKAFSSFDILESVKLLENSQNCKNCFISTIFFLSNCKFFVKRWRWWWQRLLHTQERALACVRHSYLCHIKLEWSFWDLNSFELLLSTKQNKVILAWQRSINFKTTNSNIVRTNIIRILSNH